MPVAEPTNIYKLIGERIRDERQKKRLTQDELASRIGLKRASITNVEKGRQQLLVHTLLQIADSLGTAPERFLGTSGEVQLEIPNNVPASVRNWIIHLGNSPSARTR
jgi:transcriptional regulator with XRE-family HTH domain